MKETIKEIYLKYSRFSCRQVCFSAHDRILIVAPHQDDEALGCGALISKYHDITDILLVTNGNKGNPEYTREETAKIRNDEFMQAAGYCHKVYKMELEDSEFTYSLFRNKKISFADYDYIFIPNKNEAHPDHAKTYKYIRKAIRYQWKKPRLFEYEIWTPLLRFNTYLDFSDFASRKWNMIRIYKSQLKHIDYLNKIKGLNCYRGIFVHASYAECYHMKLKMTERISAALCEMITCYLKKRSKEI